MAIKDDDLLYVQRPSGPDAGGYKETVGNLKTELNNEYLSKTEDDTAIGDLRFEGKTTHFDGVSVNGVDGNVNKAINIVGQGLTSSESADYGVFVNPNPTDGHTGEYIGYHYRGSQIKSTQSLSIGFEASDNAGNKAALNIGFKSNLPIALGNNFNFYAAGDAPNYFKGITTHESGVNVTGNGPIDHGINKNVSLGEPALNFITDSKGQLIVSENSVRRTLKTAGQTVGFKVFTNRDSDGDSTTSFISSIIGSSADLTDVTHFSAESNSTVNIGTNYGFKVNTSLNGPNVTAAYGFYSNLTDLYAGYNFYAAGNAPNFFQGKVYIGGDTTDLGNSTKINLNNDGSAEFSGNVTLPGGGGDTDALQKQEINQIIDNIKFGVNVKEFGAVGDGSVDDSGAIQAAIDACSTDDGPKKIFIPHGVYRIDRQLEILDDGISIEGESIGRTLSIFGAECTRILVNFNGNYALDIQGSQTEIKNIEFFGSDSRWAQASNNSGSRGCIKINGVACRLERIGIFRETGIGVLAYGECPNTVMSQVRVEYCKGWGFYFDDGELLGIPEADRAPVGIITMESCRVGRCDSEAVVIGKPGSTELTAYRIYQENCEYFYCGGKSGSGFVVRINGDNCTMIGCAVSSPEGQEGGNSTQTGILASSGLDAVLVRGIEINDSKNTLILNSRFIRCYQSGVIIRALAEYTKVEGVEARCVSPAVYDYAVNITDGAQGWSISRVGKSQCLSASNTDAARRISSNLPTYSEDDTTIHLTCKGAGYRHDINNNFVGFVADGTNALRVDTDSKETRLYGNLRLETASESLQMVAPNGNVWSFTVDNSGNLVSTNSFNINDPGVE